MKKRNFFLTAAAFLFSLFLTVGASAQNVLPETISFSTPKTLYFGGERVWVNLQVETPQGSTSSKIVYLELLNRYNESVAIAKVPLDQGMALNFLSLPTTLPSDHYLLRVFTRVSPYLDLSAGLKQQWITVFNPQIPPKVSPTPRTRTQSGEVAAIRLDAEGKRAGETLAATLMADTDQIVDVQVSVANPFLPNQSTLSSPDIYEKLAMRTLVPELFGHVVEGFVDEVSPDTTQLYYLSIHGNKSALFTDRPDSGGALYFDTGGIRNWRYMVAQALGNESLLRVTIVSPSPKTSFRAGFAFPELVISPEDEELLKSLLIGGQVEGYFSQKYSTESFPVVTGFVEDQTYLLDDYTRFDKVETVIKEYVPEVNIKTQDKTKQFRVLDAVQRRVFDENPLMLVDAMPVFDSDLLAKFDPSGFQKLEILTREFYLNEEEFPGVISFSSYKNDFGGFPIPTNGVYLDYPGLQYEVSDAEGLFSKNSRDGIKDWRTILYWSAVDPDFSKDRLEVTLPELPGMYQIQVTIKNAQGALETQRRLFEVKD